MGGFMGQDYNTSSGASQGANQLTDLSTKISLDNVNMDNSTSIGLQGDDLAVVAQAMLNQQVTSQTALLSSQNSSNSALAAMVESNNAAKSEVLTALKGGGKWILYVGGAIVAVFIFSKIFKKRKK